MHSRQRARCRPARRKGSKCRPPSWTEMSEIHMASVRLLLCRPCIWMVDTNLSVASIGVELVSREGARTTHRHWYLLPTGPSRLPRMLTIVPCTHTDTHTHTPVGCRRQGTFPHSASNYRHGERPVALQQVTLRTYFSHPVPLPGSRWAGKLRWLP